MTTVVSVFLSTKNQPMKKTLTLLIAVLAAFHLHAQWQSLGSGITESPREIFSISALIADVAWAVADNPILPPAMNSPAPPMGA